RAALFVRRLRTEGEMRDITQDEANRWTALAEEHGFTNDEGEVALGRFTVERVERTAFPIKTSPSRFAPSRQWWQASTPRPWRKRNRRSGSNATRRANSSCPAAVAAPFRENERGIGARGGAPELVDTATALRDALWPDSLLPPDFDTITFVLPDDDGTPLVHEPIPPETLIRIRLKSTTRRP